MSRVFIVEQLTAPVLQRFAPTIAAADRCLGLEAYESAVASLILGDPRWRPGSMTDWDRATARLKDWSRRLVHVLLPDGPQARLERGMVAAGLESRLRLAAPAVILYEDAVAAMGGGQAVDVSMVADDPYLRDAFLRGAWLHERPRSVTISGQPGSLPWNRMVRERLAQQYWLRAPMWRRGGAAPSARSGAAGKTALVMTVSQRWIKQLQPVLLPLMRRGWRIVVVHYGRHLPADRHMNLQPMGETTVSFDEASRGWRPSADRQPDWSLTDELLRASPLSRRWLRIGLSASWVSGAVQVARHRRMLDRWRPDLVFGYGTDLPSLALQIAADERSIPTVCVPHGFEVPNRSFYGFPTTATVVYGPACVEANKTGPDGQPFRGLVATGHAPHDEVVARHQQTGGRRVPLAGLAVPPSRPYLVLGLATWGFDLMSHLHQERFLRMLAAALPDDAYLLCKLHPGCEEQAFCESVLRSALPADAFRVISERDLTTPQLLAASHVAVSHERSMALSDTILAGIPAIAVRHPEAPFGVADRNHPGKDYSKTCRIVDTTADLHAALVTLTRDEVARAQLLANRQDYLARFLMADGKAAERITELVERLASGEQAEARSSVR